MVDGGALIHILTPKNVTTFSKYADQVFISFIKRELLAAKRIEKNRKETKDIYITEGTSVISRGNALPMMECTHEEADTRVMVHLLHAVENGSANVEV